MQHILNLIEETLDAEITPAELAEKSGYSLWHFLHLFQQQVGMPLCRYRTRRRLAHAIWHISRGMRVTDAALRWGFESHSGFCRAFVKEYGAPPTAWLATHRVNPPRQPVLKEEVFKMLNREKFREALTHWGDDFAALPLTPVTYPSGHVSDNAMYAGADYILKAYRDEHSARLAVTLAETLHVREIPSGRALPLPDGEPLLPLADGLWMTLCRRIPGSPMRADELIRRPEAGHRIGAALATLHQAIGDLGDLPYAEDEPYADHLLNWALPKAQAGLPVNFPADYPARVAALRTLPTCLIHRDTNPSNLIDGPEGIGFTDFDLSRRCVRIFDPCYTATAVLSETFGRDDLPWQENWPRLCKALLAGYDSVSPLTDEEWAAVPTLLIGSEVLCLAAFAGSSKYQDVYEANCRMLPWVMGQVAE